MGNAGLAEWPDVDYTECAAENLLRMLESLDYEAASERALLGAAVAAEQLCRRVEALRGLALERAARLAGTDLVNPSLPAAAAVEGIDSVAAEVGLALSLHRREALSVVGDSVMVVQHLPLLWRLVREGRLAWKIAVVTYERMRQCLSPGSAKWQKVQADLAEKLPGKMWDAARRLAARAIHSVDPQATHRRYLVEQKDCYVHAFPLADGMGGLHVKMRADQIRLIDVTLDALADAQRDRARRAGTPDERSHQQRRADFLLRLVMHTDDADAAQSAGPAGPAPSAGPGGPARPSKLSAQQGRLPHVTLFATLDSVLGLTEDQGELQGHGPVPAAQVRDIIREGARITLQIRSASGLGHGPGDQADCPETARRYKPRQSVLDKVLGNFPHCVHPGCIRPATQCDVDHAIPFAKGGRSCPCNLVPLCRAHHQLKTHGGWSLRLTRPDERHPAGTLEFRSRLGQVHLEPAPDLPETAHLPRSPEDQADATTRARLRDEARDSERERIDPSARRATAQEVRGEPTF